MTRRYCPVHGCHIIDMTCYDCEIEYRKNHNETNNSYLTKERMASRKKILERKFKAGDFDK